MNRRDFFKKVGLGLVGVAGVALLGKPKEELPSLRVINVPDKRIDIANSVMNIKLPPLIPPWSHCISSQDVPQIEIDDAHNKLNNIWNATNDGPWNTITLDINKSNITKMEYKDEFWNWHNLGDGIIYFGEEI